MNNEGPQGGNTAVAEQPPQSVAPTTENVLDQANAVVAGAEANGNALPTSPSPSETSVAPTTENVIDQANAVVAGAEANSNALPSDGAQAPAVETQVPNQLNPLSNPDTTAEAGAIHQEMVSAKAEAKVEEPKKPGLLGRIGGVFGIKASYEAPKAEANPQAPQPQQAEGVGFAPAVKSVEPLASTLPQGANTNLDMSSGTTPPVPNVTPEAQAAANATTAPSGEGAVTPTTENVIDQANAVVAGAEANGNALPADGAQAPAAETQASIADQPPSAEGPATPEVPAQQINSQESIQEPNTSTAISDYDQNVAKEGAEADNASEAQNKVDSEHPDLLAVDKPEPTVSEFTPSSDMTSADAADPNLPPAENPDETHETKSPIDSVSSAGDVQPATDVSNDDEVKPPTSETDWHVDNSAPHQEAPQVTDKPAETTPPAFSNDALQSHTDSPDATADSSQTPPPDASGNLALETTPPVKPEENTNQWDASNLTGQPTQNQSTEDSSTSAPETQGSTNTSQVTESPTVPDASVPVSEPTVPEIQAPTASVDSSPQSLAPEPTAVEPANEMPAASPSQEPADASPQTTRIETPSSSIASSEVPAQENPSNITGITPDVTPQTQTQEQINAAQSGMPLSMAGGEQPAGPAVESPSSEDQNSGTGTPTTQAA